MYVSVIFHFCGFDKERYPEIMNRPAAVLKRKSEPYFSKGKQNASFKSKPKSVCSSS